MLKASICLFVQLALGAALVERRQDDDVPIEDYRRRLLESGASLGDLICLRFTDSCSRPTG